MANSNITSIDNDTYLIIVPDDDDKQVEVRNYDLKQAQDTNNFLNKSFDTGIIGNIGMAVWTSPVAQNFAGKYLPNAVLNRVNSSLYDIMSDGKIGLDEVAEDFIGNCTNILDNMATDLGFPTPSALYNAIKPGGTGVISKDFIKLFAKKANEENISEEELQNKQKQNIELLKFHLVTNDSIKLSTSLPSRRTENGFDLITSAQNDNIERSFKVEIVQNEKRGIDIYEIKNKLESIRDNKKTFTIFINDSDLRKQESLINCMFSDINIAINGKNGLSIDFSVISIPKWQIKTAPLPKGILNKGTIVSKNGNGKKVKKQNTSTQAKNTKTKSNYNGVAQLNQLAKDDANTAKSIVEDINKIKTDIFRGNYKIGKNPELAKKEIYGKIYTRTGGKYTPYDFGITGVTPGTQGDQLIYDSITKTIKHAPWGNRGALELTSKK